MITKIYNGKTFILLHHLVTNEAESSFFPDLKTANLSVDDYNQYSIVKLIDDDPSFKSKSGYEFILEYPEHSEYFYHWRQDISPFKITDQTTFKEINFYGYSSPLPYFRGLYGLTPHAVLRGKCENYDCGWCYAIGAITKKYSPEFPGPIDTATEDKQVNVHECFLWLRFVQHITHNLKSPRTLSIYILVSFIYSTR